MNPAQLHLILNHWPAALLPAGLVVLLIGMSRANQTARRIGLALLFSGSVLGAGAYLTGEGAEEYLEDAVPTVDHKLIHEHEEQGEKAGYAMIANALLIGAIALIKKPNVRGYALYAIVGVSVGSMVLSALAGQSGGHISHPELRGVIAPVDTPAAIDGDARRG